MSDTAPSQLHELVAIATLGEGILREGDEHRILKVALAGGLSPRAALAEIEEALHALGARRAVPSSMTVALPTAATPTAAELEPAPGPERTEGPATGVATEDALEKAIARKLGKRPASASFDVRRAEATTHASPPRPEAKEPPPPGRSPDTPSSGEIVVAELVLASPDPVPARAARKEEETLGVCSACLAPVSLVEVRAGRAEVHGETKHCRACLSKLRAGLLCLACYRAIDRTELQDGRAVLRGDRAIHESCLTVATKTTVRFSAPLPGSMARGVAPTGGTPLTGRVDHGPRKCASCHVVLTRAQFVGKRALEVNGVAYCAGCAARAGTG